MKILVYGAGVLGCNLARNLLRAGKDVTLLARGNWAAEIKQNGLRIKDKFSPRTSVSRIPVVTELAPDATYDVIFVVLRYTQLDSVLYTLRANRTKTSFLWATTYRQEHWRRTAGEECPVCLCTFCRASGVGSGRFHRPEKDHHRAAAGYSRQ